jgi:hypothetical protein
MKTKLEKLEELWEGLENITMNDEEQIEQDYHIWEKGTDIHEIWHWFDERLPQGLGKFLDGE